MNVENLIRKGFCLKSTWKGSSSLSVQGKCTHFLEVPNFLLGGCRYHIFWKPTKSSFENKIGLQYWPHGSDLHKTKIRLYQNNGICITFLEGTVFEKIRGRLFVVIIVCFHPSHRQCNFIQQGQHRIFLMDGSENNVRAQDHRFPRPVKLFY